MGIYTSVNESGAKVFDEAGYLAALRTRGRQELAAHRPKRGISAQIMPSAAEGIEVGDICTLFLARLGYKRRSRDGEDARHRKRTECLLGKAEHITEGVNL